MIRTLRRTVRGRVGSILAWAGFAAVLIFLAIAPDSQGEWTYPDVLFSAPMMLKGHSQVSEIATDIYGFRALTQGWDPYSNLRQAMPRIGGSWPDDLPTTHPPTAFLLVAPVAYLPLPAAFAAWGWLMVAAIVVSLRATGFSWPSALMLGAFSLLWPPTTLAIGNLPCLWMLGVALAYRQRNQSPFFAGMWIGFASLTKFLPAVLLFPFLVKKKWTALAGFLSVWALALAILVILSPISISRYLAVSQDASSAWIGWIGNGSPLVFLYRYFQLPGLGAGLYLLLLMLTLNWRLWWNRVDRISPQAWHLFSLFSVVLLPIAWTYSFAPILPGVLALSGSATPKRLLGMLALAAPVIGLGLGFPPAGILLLILIPYGLYWILPPTRLFR